MRTALARLTLAFAAIAALGSAATTPSIAHDLPGKVSLLVYVKHAPDQLLVLTRVPMEAVTEIEFPLRGPGYLDFSRAARATEDAANIYVRDGIEVLADGSPLARGELRHARVALPADKSFVDFESALAAVQSPPLSDSVDLYWKQGWLDVLIAYPRVRADAKLAVRTGMARISQETHTVLRYIQPDGSERIYTYTGDPGLIELDPSWWRAAYRFVALGFVHILEGVDHLLFLLCLVIPARSVRALIPVITGFTVAHSITLISSALGVVPTADWFGPFIETAIALSVFYMACENLLGLAPRKRELVVFGFGLVHGFGFSFILADRMQFAGEHLVSALLAFNVGVEFGQLVVLIVAVPLLRFFFQVVGNVQTAALSAERAGIILLSALVAHTAWHWLIERGAVLWRYSWTPPVMDAAFAVAAIRWVMLLLASGAALWGMNECFEWWRRRAAICHANKQ